MLAGRGGSRGLIAFPKAPSPETMGETSFIRVRMSERDAHYGGKLCPGAKVMELFGDIATELAIRHDGDEGLLAGYEYVKFLAPVFAGDFIEARGGDHQGGQHLPMPPAARPCSVVLEPSTAFDLPSGGTPKGCRPPPRDLPDGQPPNIT